MRRTKRHTGLKKPKSRVSTTHDRRLVEPILFRHGCTSWPVVRRAFGEFLQFTAVEFFTAMATCGRSLRWSVPDASLYSYAAARQRLRRAGWRAERKADGGPPVLNMLDDPGAAPASPRVNPERRWNRRWDGTWWVLCYDVPESQRSYRNHLRQFVRRLGMGCLQRSVFITTDDIRPDYDDLAKAAAVTDYSALFAARSVLGRSDGDLARVAWRMDSLLDRQAGYRIVANGLLERVCRGEFDLEDLRRLREEAFFVYWDVLRDDPLLPRAAWPRGYAGEEIRDIHRQLQHAIMTRMLRVAVPFFRRNRREKTVTPPKAGRRRAARSGTAHR